MNKGEILIRVTKSLTRNMGNYNSARIEYGMEKVVDLADEEKTIQELKLKIDEYLNEELEELVATN